MKKIKLTEEEIQTLKELENRNIAIVKEFGQISIAEYNLDKRRDRAEEFIEKLRKLETDIAKQLEEKYGKGTVNTTTGEFNAI